jgi:hypothetical protein
MIDVYALLVCVSDADRCPISFDFIDFLLVVPCLTRLEISKRRVASSTGDQVYLPTTLSNHYLYISLLTAYSNRLQAS